jgi:hypothetical protein
VRAFRACFSRELKATPQSYRAESRRKFTAVAVRRGLSSALFPDQTERWTGAYADASDALPWHQLDLSAEVNAAFASGPRPWFGQPLLHVRAGLKRIHGVPFLIRKEGAILLRSAHVVSDANGQKLPTRVALAAPSRVTKAYFLHACGWGARPGRFAAYRWHWADGEVTELALIVLGHAHPDEPEGRIANIQDWYYSYNHLGWSQARPYDLKPRADPTAASQFLYTLEWVNPTPARELKHLEVVSDPKEQATLALLAVTALPLANSNAAATPPSIGALKPSAPAPS